MGESLGSLHAHVCTYRIPPPQMCPSSSVSSESPDPDLRLGKQLLWEHCHTPPAPSWAPLAWAGRREPPKNATGSAYVHAQSWGSDGAGLCCLVPQAGLGCPPLLSRAPRPPPQSSPCSLGLSLGPPPSADSTSSEPQALPFLSCSQGTASAPPCTPRAGVRWASWLSPPYEAPLPQAQHHFCRVHAASLSHLCLVL